MSFLFDDASSEYLEIDESPVSDYGFYVQGWMRPDQVTDATCAIFIGDKDSANDWLAAAIMRGSVAGDPIAATSKQGISAAVADSTTGITINVWHHFYCEHAADDDRKVKLDGGSEGTNTTSKSPSTADRTSIGRKGDQSPSEEWSGYLAEISVGSGTLSAAQVNNLAAGMNIQLVDNTNILSYWPLINNARDFKGNLNLTEFNTPTNDPEVHPTMIYPVAPDIQIKTRTGGSGLFTQTIIFFETDLAGSLNQHIHLPQGRIARVLTAPTLGSIVTDNWDLELMDEYNEFDYLDGELLNRDTVNTEVHFPRHSIATHRGTESTREKRGSRLKISNAGSLGSGTIVIETSHDKFDRV